MSMSSPDSGQKLPEENAGKGTVSEGAGERCHFVSTGSEPTCLCQPSISMRGAGWEGGRKMHQRLQGGQQGPLGSHCSARRGPWSLSHRKPHGQRQDLLKLGGAPCQATTSQVGWVVHRSLGAQTPQARQSWQRGEGSEG